MFGEIANVLVRLDYVASIIETRITARCERLRRTTGDRMAAHRKSD